MSIDMHLPESQAQARTTHSMVQGQIQAFESLQTAISNFAASTELDSRTYQSAKDYFSTVFAALARGGQQLAQAVARAVAKFPEDYQAQVHTQTLKQSELEIQIAAFDTLISDLEDINDQDSSGEKALHFRGMLGAYSGMRKILQEKLDAPLAFNNSSEAIFADISHLANALQTGIDQTTTAWNPQKGVFITTDRQEWMEEIDEIVLRIFTTNMASEYGLSEEAAADLFPFYDQYGFDEKTVYHLHLVRQGIDEQFSEKSQEDRDYLFLRVLGGAIYGQEDWVDEFKWDQTAGDLNAAPNTTPYAIGSTRGTYFGTPMPRNKEPFETNDVREIYQELGLSEEQANELYYEIRLQNNMAPGEFKDSAEIKRKNIGQYRQYKSTAESAYGSMTDTEFDAFWDARRDRYAGQADFAHQSITTATEMRDFQLPLIKELAGWRGGDATNQADAEPSMGNDDYMADLDAVNIDRRMESSGRPFAEVQREYYAEIEAGQANRAVEFKSHVDYEHVKQQVYSLVPTQRWVSSPNGNYGYYIPLPESEIRDHLKSKYPASYNFLRSLEEEDNELGNYSE